VSRVHCLECGRQVVVDPRGQCPDGHTVGTPGNRIAMAMGHESAHPDEPEPWVYRIEPSEVDGDAAQAAGERSLRVAGTAAEGSTNGAAPAREARPVRAPGLPQGGEDDEPADAESLLRELHSLAALDTALTQRNGHGAADGQPRQGPPAIPATPPPPPTQATTPTPRPRRGDPEEIADAFAELSALDVPASSSNGHRPAAPATGSTPPSPPHEAAAADAGPAVDALASLFGDGPLFGQDDQPEPSVDDARAAAPDEPLSTPAAAAGGDDAIAADVSSDDDSGLAAMFLAADPTPTAPETAGSTPTTPAEDEPPTDADAAAAPPPAVELRPRRSSASPARDQAAASSQPVSAAAGSAQVLDLSSFTAKGGPGAGRSAGRRRRFGR
jgi:hypothetical protein